MAQRPQTQADDYTRYELQAPGSHAFRIIYDVSATTPGAVNYFNSIRAGAEEIVHGVYDRMTGGALKWEVVDGAKARREGHPTASLEGRYIKVVLARPVAASGGEARVRIDKTYMDSASYIMRGDTIIFTRSLGIKRNAVVLPAGYELVGVNFPSQVFLEADGRVRVSFMNAGSAAVPYTVRGVKRARPLRASPEAALPRMPASGAPAAIPSMSERAFQDREIVYFLNSPESHSFRLYHDYTESRPGIDRYINVVRAGSTVSNPSATLLDTGAALKTETLRGAAIQQRGLDIGQEVRPETEVVLITFDAVKPGQSARLRIEETYTDPARYALVGEELVWDRTFGRPYNAVVLPAGWSLSHSTIPATVSLMDGRVRLDYANDRPDEIRVYIKAQRR